MKLDIWAIEWPEDPPLRTLHVELPPNTDVTDFVEQLQREHATDIATADAFIVRLPIGEKADNIDVETFRQRAPGRTAFHFLYLDEETFEPVLSPSLSKARQSPFERGARQDEALRRMRQAELRRLIHTSGALFKKVGSYLYRVPSKLFTSSFLRVGSMATTRASLDVFAFWALQYLRGSDVVVTDTWSIAAIAFHASMRVGEMDAEASSIRVAFMSRYHDDSDAAREEFADIMASIPRSATKVVFLESASSTGRMVKRFRAAVDDAPLQANTEHVCLYKLGSSSDLQEGIFLCDLSEPSDDADFTCRHEPPEDPNAVIEIDSVSYFPLHIAVSEVRISPPATAASAPLFSKYAGAGAFSVHHDDVDPVASDRWRHHAIHIDVSKLLRHEGFVSRIAETARNLSGNFRTTPRFVVHPPHAAPREFARTLLEHLSIDVEVIEDDDLNISDDRMGRLTALTASDEIIIIDDVSITGTRLKQYQFSLRDKAEFKGRIHYVVGVARPESDAEWARRRRELRYRQGGPSHELYCAEYVLLPNWDHRRCPWCRESAAYRLQHVPPAIARRADLLTTAVAKGLTDRLFFTRDGVDVPPVKENSIFIGPGATQSEVFAAVASVVQRLRTGGVEKTPKLAGPEYPHVSVLARTDWMNDTFNTELLRLSLLRACGPQELTYPRLAEEQMRAEYAATYLASAQPELFAIELALAIRDGKLLATALPRDVIDSMDDDTREIVRIIIGR